MERLVVFPPIPSLLPLFISVTGACLLEGMVAYGWVVRFCQPSVQSPSWSWLPIFIYLFEQVEVSGRCSADVDLLYPPTHT